MKINFYGAVQEITGSKHLITLKSGKKILLDCGFFQGRGSESARKNRELPFDPTSIDYLILTHAHIDHSGNIPLLIKKGFKGVIYCTPATFDLCKIMLADSAYIQQSDITFINKRRLQEGKKTLEPIYNPEDVSKSWQYFKTIPYNETVKIDNEINLIFTDAGHILGSAVCNLTITENNKPHRITYTGDVGRYINKILNTPQKFSQANTIICESTYGDRLHESIKIAKKQLLEVVHKTCIEKKGKLIIPAFSIGKTQELVYMQ